MNSNHVTFIVLHSDQLKTTNTTSDMTHLRYLTIFILWSTAKFSQSFVSFGKHSILETFEQH